MIIPVNYSSVDLKLKIAETRQMIYVNTEDFIRGLFDKDITSLEAKSLIAIAKEKGLKDLAIEMENDLHTETLEV